MSSETKRSLDVHFWWDIVRPRDKVGTGKDKRQEGSTEEEHVLHLFDVMCSNEEARDFDDVEVASPDDDCASVVSSTMGSIATCNDDSPVDDDVGDGDDVAPDWEALDVNERESNITNTLKKLGNIMSKKT